MTWSRWCTCYIRQCIFTHMFQVSNVFIHCCEHEVFSSQMFLVLFLSFLCAPCHASLRSLFEVIRLRLFTSLEYTRIMIKFILYICIIRSMGSLPTFPQIHQKPGIPRKSRNTWSVAYLCLKHLQVDKHGVMISFVCSRWYVYRFYHSKSPWNSPWFGESLYIFCPTTFQGTNISHLGKRKLIFKSILGGDMLVPRRVPNTQIKGQGAQT